MATSFTPSSTFTYTYQPVEPFTTIELIGLILRLFFIAPARILLHTTRCFLSALSRGIPPLLYLMCGYVRYALGELTPRQMQHLFPNSRRSYKRWVASRRYSASRSAAQVPTNAFVASRLAYDVEVLPQDTVGGDAAIMWVGDRRRATKIVLFLHGGGYILPCQPGHLDWCLRAYVKHPKVQELMRQGEDGEVAVAVLQYTLAPEAKYPGQLRQAAAALAHLLRSGWRAGDIVFGGDSAGGNLTVQLLGHLLHPHPAAERIVLPEGESIAGAFAVSPWVSVRTDWESFERNGWVDMLHGGMIQDITVHLLDGAMGYNVERSEGLGWAMALDMDEEAFGEWFGGLGRVVGGLYVTVGEQEILMDQGVEFAERVRKFNPGFPVRLDKSRNEAHDFIMLEAAVQKDGDAILRMRDWVGGVFWP
ncbi:Alpha/Beta hydrolase protein [Bombardia bombarda]|uniref:Alpha/Beta hydrolase protein n=1 Tax=Bombardia bombarda TaxID=252184 RepID=A0AA39TGK8_9PEZI|nr:Alpha/Beta hydrolase protein [Bombardia bombarda]